MSTRTPDKLVRRPWRTQAFAYGILRQENTSRGGQLFGLWFAQIRRQSREIQRHFVDHTFGGKEDALALAIAWRDAVHRLVPPVTKRQAQTRPHSNNTSGTSGVSLWRVQGRIVAWKATLETADRHYCKFFFITTHGNQRAKELAIAERQRMIERHGTDAFLTLNAHATQKAAQHFGHLLNDPGNPEATLTSAQITQRIRALNQWFDQLHPNQLHVRLKIRHPSSRGKNGMAHALITSFGPQIREAHKGLSLTKLSYQQRLPELWQFIGDTITAWHGRQCWQDFAASHEDSFLNSTEQSDFRVRHYSAPPDYPQCLTPPASLQPMLADFALPELSWLAPLSKD